MAFFNGGDYIKNLTQKTLKSTQQATAMAPTYNPAVAGGTQVGATAVGRPSMVTATYKPVAPVAGVTEAPASGFDYNAQKAFTTPAAPTQDFRGTGYQPRNTNPATYAPLTDFGRVYQQNTMNTLQDGTNSQVQSAQGALDRNAAIRSYLARKGAQEGAAQAGYSPGSLQAERMQDRSMQQVNQANLGENAQVNTLRRQSYDDAMTRANAIETTASANELQDKRDVESLINSVQDPKAQAFLRQVQATGGDVRQAFDGIHENGTVREAWRSNTPMKDLYDSVTEEIKYTNPLKAGETPQQYEQRIAPLIYSRVRQVNDAKLNPITDAQKATADKATLTSPFNSSTTDPTTGQETATTKEQRVQAARDATPEQWQAALADPAKVAQMKADGIIPKQQTTVPEFTRLGDVEGWLKTQGYTNYTKDGDNLTFNAGQEPLVMVNGKPVLLTKATTNTYSRRTAGSFGFKSDDYRNTQVFGRDLTTGQEIQLSQKSTDI